MKKIFAIAKYEIANIFLHDIRRGILLIFAASAYLLLFSWLYLFGIVNHIPMLIVDQDNTAISRNLTQKFADSDAFEAVAWGDKLEDVESWFHTQGRHSAALVIPKDFGKKIQTETQSNVMLVVDASNIIVSSNSNIAAFDIVQSFNQEMGRKLIARDVSQVPYLAELRLEPVKFNYRILGNPQLDYLRFFVFGLALIAMQQGILLAVAAAVLWQGNKPLQAEWELKPWQRWLLKSCIYWVLGMAAYALFLNIGSTFFVLPVAAGLKQHLLIGGSFIFCLIQLAGVLAGVCKDELLFTRISVSYTVPAFILSGFTWPLEPMPSWVRFLAYFSPYTYVSEAARSLYIYGYYYRLNTNAALLFAVGLVCFPLAARLYSKRMRRC